MNWELIMISSDKENLIWEVLQVRTQQSLKWALQLQNQLRDIQKQVSDICIYRPIKAYKMIKTLSFEVGKLEKEITNVVEELQKIIMLAPDNNMGNILSSCLDTIRLATKITHLQTQWGRVESSIQQTGAFSFAIFSLYISLISTFVSLILPILMK